ncbi:MAG TPA: SRPBCC family protein [Solirubrobacterales bacterium]
MGKAAESIVIDAPLAEVWDFYFQPETWPTWVDQFARVESSSGYPETGGTLRWQSVRAGRGEVTERVLAHEPRTLHRISFRDPESEGELEVRFSIEPGEGSGATRVEQRLEYAITSGGVLSGLTDALFVRSQMRGSLQRSLARLRLEVMDAVRAG